MSEWKVGGKAMVTSPVQRPANTHCKGQIISTSPVDTVSTISTANSRTMATA